MQGMVFKLVTLRYINLLKAFHKHDFHLWFSFSLNFTSGIFILLQISARIPFKVDICFISGTGVKNSRVEERVSSLTGFSYIHLI